MSVRGHWCTHDLSISDELLKHLQTNVDFINLEEKELESNGFTRCVDAPQVPNHIYYEGYFHGLSTTSGAANSINPRLGDSMMKPAAPLTLRAFICVFKEHNENWLNDAIKDTFIEKLKLQKQLFCDFAVQIHFGDHIDSKNIGWHMDSVNSMLHLALSLHGKRGVYYKVNKDMKSIINSNDNDLDTKENDLEYKDGEIKIKWQNEGNAYLSSPYAYLHGVEYPEIEWKDRIIACQCRWLINMDQYNIMINHAREWEQVMNQITDVLRKSKVMMPTLQQVLEMEKLIVKKQSNKDIREGDKRIPVKNDNTCAIL
eukprot:119310_1